MNDNDFQKWLDKVMQRSSTRPNANDIPRSSCIRVTNDRIATHSTFEDRLTLDDKLLLRAMGIAI